MEIKLLTKTDLETNLQEFCDLYHLCFNDKINTKIVRQRYLENPLDELQMCVAIDNNKIVANYSVSPTILSIGGREWKCAISLNTMTHPEYVGQGLFVKLAQRLNEHLRNEDYGMVYGFPNYISNRTFVTKLQWKNIYEYPTLELQINNKLDYSKENIVEYENVDSFANINSKLIHVDKNADYLKWRYISKPNVQYYFIGTLSGSWCIYKYYEKMINIVDVNIITANDIYDIIGYLSDKCVLNNLEKMTVWSAINTEQHLIFEKLGFRNRYPVTYFGCLDLGISKNLDIDLFDHRNWIINMGDDNVY